MDLNTIGWPLLIAAVVSALFEAAKRNVAVIKNLPPQGKQAVVVALAFVLVGIAQKLGVTIDASSVLTGLASMGVYTLYQK